MYKGEFLNSISHLIGAVLAIAGLAVLVVLAARQGDPWKIVSFSIYGAMLVLLYVCSTLYHSLRGRAKEIFRKFDHHAIYLLIAGTYTPFTLISLRGVWGWSLFGVIWGLAALGMIQEIWSGKGKRIQSGVIYVVMGWLALIAVKPLLDVLTFAGFMWVMTGGLFYTVGIIFFALSEKVRHAHGLWHLFVLAGSVTHYFAILFYVA